MSSTAHPETDGDGLRVERAAEARLVVAIGASAGGLQAIEELFRALPSDIDAAFVVIQHLSPDFRSLMDELLARQTNLSVRIAADGLPLRKRTVSLLPPRKNMIVVAGRLLLTERADQHKPNLPIDIFFRSLAHEYGARAVGVVLSGTGSDGSRGLEAIKRAGGRAFVQSPESARFDGMPRAALAAVEPDAIGTPEQLAVRIGELLGDQRATDPPGGTAGTPERRLLELLRAARSVDFRLYKSGTVERRVQRRMAIRRIEALPDYVALVERDDSELDALFRDLLVSVTSFFRDPEAFESLERRVIPELVDAGLADGSLRMWCVGCATGEEAYSIAMLVQDEILARGVSLDFKLFATDIDARALAIATAGRYGADALAPVSGERRERYFVEDADGFVVRRELRDRIVFALHDLTRDPPFTRMHLLSCRNLLIYLQTQHQVRLLNVLHFGLAARGFLFLGPSEFTTPSLASEFEDIDRKWNLFRKKRDVRMLLPDQLSELSRPSSESLLTASAARKERDAEIDVLERVAAALLRDPADVAVLLGPNNSVQRIFGDPERFLRLPEGRPNTDLLRMVAPELRTALSVALSQATRKGQPVSARGVAFAGPHGPMLADAHVVRLAPSATEGQPLFLVKLGARDRDPASAEPPPTLRIDDAAHQRIEALEFELKHTKENLHATVEELETANEELQSTNEELLASNEELQSTNEELHSVNEELFTVNAEHQAKIEELLELSNDVENLMRATEIGTIFLDAELHIRKFTPAITRAIALVEHDVGRPLSHLAHAIENVRLVDTCRFVLESGETIEREVSTRDGGSFLLRVLPYHESRKRIRGVALTLVDVREIKSAQASLARSEARFRELVENIDEVFWIRTADGRDILYLSPQFERVFGHDAEAILAEPERLLDHVHAEDRERVRSYLHEELPARRQAEVTYRVLRSDGSLRWIHSRGHPVLDERGDVLRVVGFARDITDAKRQEQALIAMTRKLEGLANRDPLTGLWNRRGLDSQLSHEIERAVRSGSWLVAVMIDLDDFKAVNDRLGHSAGDVVLKGIAERMAESLRPNDVLARIGGDEFLALLPETRIAEAMQVAERLRLAISDSPIRLSGEMVRASASLGVARVSDACVSVEEILGRTRHALARGKLGGKNRVVLSDGDEAERRGDDDASTILETVLAGRGIRAVGQTIRDLHTGEVVGHELLSRGPRGTYENPEALFRLAIERNVLGLVDLQCFKTCVRTAGRIQHGRMHVNLYPSTLLDTPLDGLLAMLDAAGGPERFCIEISEQQFLGDPNYLADATHELRRSGVKIAIDDVGFGRSSLESLIVLEPDLIKVDRSFVAGTSTNPAKARNLQRLIHVSQHLTGELIAEGVETERERSLLAELGVRFAQGFLWGRPAEVTTPIDT
ncbi:MAG: diguanylate cyclase [Planctomycetes bacterium]|nr:diguanylate cyclase [Planctomycetota bacterium]